MISFASAGYLLDEGILSQFGSSFRTLLSTSSRLTDSPRVRNGPKPVMSSYTMQPSPNQSTPKEYRSFLKLSVEKTKWPLLKIYDWHFRSVKSQILQAWEKGLADLMTSGAMYPIVPTRPFTVSSPAFSLTARPRSEMRTFPRSSRRQFSGFKSRYRMPSLCKS